MLNTAALDIFIAVIFPRRATVAHPIWYRRARSDITEKDPFTFAFLLFLDSVEIAEFAKTNPNNKLILS